MAPQGSSPKQPESVLPDEEWQESAFRYAPPQFEDLLRRHEANLAHAMEDWFQRLAGIIEPLQPAKTELTEAFSLAVNGGTDSTSNEIPKVDDSNSPAGWQSRNSYVMNSEEDLESEKKCLPHFCPQPKEEGAYVWQIRLRRLVESWMFEALFASVIFTNSAFIAVQVEIAASNPGQPQSDALFAVATTYTFLFTLELLLRLVARPSVICGEDWAWLLLDTTVVLTSLLEFALELPLHAEGEAGSNGIFSNMRLLRVLRVAKITRALRIIRVVKFVRSLKSLLFCIGRTMRALAWSGVLLFLIIFLFGLIFTDISTEFFARSESGGDTSDFLSKRFNSLASSMHTLYASITGGFTWVEARDAFSEIDLMWGWLFEAYIAFCLFAVLNVMTGVFCHSAIESAEKDHELNLQMVAAERAKYFRAVKRLFAQLDKDQDGGITAKEFEIALETPALMHVFDALELSVEDAWALFRTLDSDGDSRVGPLEFLEGCLRLKGAARSIDVVCIKRDLASVSNKLDTQAAELMGALKQTLRRLS